MIIEICSYNEDISKTINIEGDQSPIDYYFFLLAIMLQQKLINKADTEHRSKEITLYDFMSC